MIQKKSTCRCFSFGSHRLISMLGGGFAAPPSRFSSLAKTLVRRKSAPHRVGSHVLLASIVYRSYRWTLHEHLLFQRRLCRQGVDVMAKQKTRRPGYCVPWPSGFLPVKKGSPEGCPFSRIGEKKAVYLSKPQLYQAFSGL